MLKSKREFIQAQMILQPPNHRRWWVLVWIAMLVIELNVFMDFELLQTLAAGNENNPNKASINLLTEHDWEFKIFKGIASLNVISWLGSQSQAFIIILAFLLAILALATLACSLGMWSQRLFGLNPIHVSYCESSQSNFLFKLFRTFNYLPEFFFIFSVLLLTSCIPCKEIADNFLQESSEGSLVQTTLVAGALLNTSGDKNPMIEVSAINNHLTCQGIGHFITCFALGITTVACSIQVVLSHELLTQWPEPVVPTARRGIAFLFQLAGVVITILVKLTIRIEGSMSAKTQTMTLNLVGLVILSGSILYQVINPVYLDRKFSRLEHNRLFILLGYIGFINLRISSQPTSSFISFVMCTIFCSILMKVSRTMFENRMYSGLDYSDDRLLETAFEILLLFKSSNTIELGQKDGLRRPVLIESMTPQESLEVFLHIKRLKLWSLEFQQRSHSKSMQMFQANMQEADYLESQNAIIIINDTKKSPNNAVSKDGGVIKPVAKAYSDQVVNYGYNQQATKSASYDSFDFVLNMLQQVLENRLTNLAPNLSKRSDPTFMRLLNLLVALLACYRKNLFLTMGLLSKMTGNAKQLDAGSKDNLESVTSLAKHVILLTHRMSNSTEKDSLLSPIKANDVYHYRKSSSNYGPMLEYLEIFQKTCFKTADILKLRKQFVEDLLTRGADSHWAYSFGKQFTGLSKDVEEGFYRMKSISLDMYTPAALVEHNYSFHILQDELRAKKKLHECIKRRFTSRFHLLANDPQLQNNELSVIVASLEKESLQKMRLVTANVGKILQFSSQDLIGNLVLDIIPEPIRSIHSELCNPSQIKSSHRSKMKSWQVLPIKRKSGTVRPFLMKKLLAFDINNGLLGILMIKHPSQDSQDNICVVSENGSFLEVDDSLREIFERGASVGEHCEELLKALSTSLYFQSKFLHKGLPSVNDLSGNKKLLLSYRQLLELRLGQNFTLKVKDNQEASVQVKLTTLYLPDNRTMMRMLSVSWISQTTIGDNSSNIASLEYAKAFLLEDLEVGETELISFLQNFEQSANYFTESPEMHDRHLSYNLTQLTGPRNMATSQTNRTVRFELNQQPSENTPDAEAKGSISHLELENEEKESEKLSGASKKSAGLARPAPALKGSSVGRESSKGHSGYAKSEYLLYKFQERILRKGGDSESCYRTSFVAVISSILILLLVVLHIVCVYTGNLIFAQARRDISIVMPTLDYLIWSYNMATQLPDFALLGRSMRKGIISEDLMKVFYPNETLAVTLETTKIQIFSPVLYQIYMIVARRTNQTSGVKDGFLQNLLWTESTETKDLRSIGAGRYFDTSKDKIDTLELVSVFTMMLTKYATMSEEDFSPDKNQEREELLSVFDSLRHFVGDRLLKLEAYTEQTAMGLVEHTRVLVLRWTIAGYAALAAAFVILLLSTAHTTSQMKSFYSQYFFVLRNDVVDYQTKLNLMDEFWSNLLSDQWQAFRKGESIFKASSWKGESHRKIKEACKPATVYQPERADLLNSVADPSSKENPSPVGNSALEAVAAIGQPIKKQKKLKQVISGKMNNRIMYSDSSEKTNLSLKWMFLIFLAIIGPISIVSGISAAKVLNQAEILTNQVRVYVLIMQMYFSNVSQVSILINMALVPNFKIMMKQPVDAIFMRFNKQMTTTIAGGFESLLSENLGSFQKDYAKVAGELTICEMNKLLEVGSSSKVVKFEPGCGKGELASFNSKFTTMIHQYASLLSDIYKYGVRLPEDQKYLLTKDPRWSKLMTYCISNSVIGAVYYLLLLALSPALADLLKFDGPEPGLVLGSARDKLFFSLQIMLLAVGAVILLTAVVAPAERTLRIFRNTCLLLPWRLALQNPLLSHHFRR